MVSHVTWKPRETAMLLLAFVQLGGFSPRLLRAVEGKVRMGHGLVAPLTWYAPLMGNVRGDFEGIGGTHMPSCCW